MRFTAGRGAQPCALTNIPRLTIAAVCFLLAALILLFAGVPQRTVLQPNVQAPVFTLPTLNDELISLEDLRGSPVIINFWATWCVPCRIEMPALQQLHETENIPVLAINLQESPASVGRWVDELGLTFDVLLTQDGTIPEAYGMRAPPATFVISPAGLIVRVFYGPVTASQIRDVLEDL